MSNDLLLRTYNELGKVLDLLAHTDNSTGYCMCGSPVEGHGLGDGHSPVDEGQYMAQQLKESVETLRLDIQNAKAQEPSA